MSAGENVEAAIARQAARLPYLDSIVRDAAAARDVRLEPNSAGAYDVVTQLGERIHTDDLATTAEVLVYTHTLRPFDGRYLGSLADVDRAIDGY